MSGYPGGYRPGGGNGASTIEDKGYERQREYPQGMRRGEIILDLWRMTEVDDVIRPVSRTILPRLLTGYSGGGYQQGGYAPQQPQQGYSGGGYQQGGYPAQQPQPGYGGGQTTPNNYPPPQQQSHGHSRLGTAALGALGGAGLGAVLGRHHGQHGGGHGFGGHGKQKYKHKHMR